MLDQTALSLTRDCRGAVSHRPDAAARYAVKERESEPRRSPQTGGHLCAEPEERATFLRRRAPFSCIIRWDIGGLLLLMQATFAANKGQLERSKMKHCPRLKALPQMKWLGSAGVLQELNWQLFSCRLNGLAVFWQHCTNMAKTFHHPRLYVFSTFALTKAGWKQLMSQKPV